MNRNLLSIVIVCVIICSGCCQRPPTITVPHPEEFIHYPDYPEELVVEQGNTFTLRCEHSSPVNWSLPSSVIGPDEDSSEIEWTLGLYTFKNSTSSMYVADLKIENAQRRQTGYCYCKNIFATSDKDIQNSANVYVYVRDPEKIFVMEGDEPQLKHVLQYRSVTFDACRTSSPDVNVTLFVDNVQYTNDDEYSFDPRVGYTVKHIEDVTYKCVGQRKDGKKEESDCEVSVMPHKESVSKPHINSTIFHAGEGSSITLQCLVVVDHDVLFQLFWVAPSVVSQDRITNYKTKLWMTTDQNNDLKKVGSVLLTISDTRPSDSGEYTCVVKDHVNNTESTTKNIIIFSEEMKFINITKQEPIMEKAGSNVKWVVPYRAHPEVNITWTFNGRILGVPNDNFKYNITTSKTETKLQINNIQERDAGNYTLTARNSANTSNTIFSLTVKFAPKINSKPHPDLYYDHMKTYNISCDVRGFPEPDVSWYFRRCDKPPNCPGKKVLVDPTKIPKHKGTSTYLRKADQSGYITCEANNSEGNTSHTIPFWVSDVKDGFEASSTPSKVFTGDNVTLECAVSKINYTDNISWIYTANSKPPMTIRNIGIYNVEPTSTHFSYKSSLTIRNVTSQNSGSYICSVIDTVSLNQTKAFQIEVKEPKAPVMNTTNMKGNDISVKMKEEVVFICKVLGEPKPEIKWYKDSMLLDNTSKTIRISDDQRTLTIIAAFEEGTYSCRGTNRAGSVQESIKLTFVDKPTNTAAIVTIVLISIIVIVLLVLLIKKIMKEKQLRKEFREIGLEQFEKGAIESLNQELPIDDQAELLPYDRKWEFPSDKLKLGKQLGAGAFGVVMKADAVGIVEGEAISTVAVKMVKRNADSTYIKALASELKIMVHLGKHLNVVNLLGACTKNLNKRELYVIVEYCRFGNLHNYLLRHRSDFIDQVDPGTGKIDTNIGADIFARHESIVAKNRRKYSAQLSFSRSRADSEMSVEFRPSPSSSDSREVNSASALISMAPVGDNLYLGEEGMMLSNNSIQPEWRSNYGGDYKGNVKPICTRDLLCWAFQVARGMEYLAGRKVLHGDLAARNILLSDDNIVKICDFGLAKSMYKSDNYRKKGDGPLPIKWMAIESIRDRIFSTQSDVWSFGIVLWEFFSLAKTPYPGMEADEKLYNKLVEGYRMDKPEYATREIQHIMDRCWTGQPASRPTFGELSEFLGNMMEESVRMHYIDLNDPYMSMNMQWREGQKSDYLAMVSAPTYDNMVAPVLDEIDLGRHYVNGSIVVDSTPGTSSEPDDSRESGYLLMKPASVIFSPRTLDTDKRFNFPEKRHTQDDSTRDSCEARPLTGCEEYKNPSFKPTLVNNLNKNSLNSFDGNMDMGDTKESRPNFTPSFSNPSYASMPPMSAASDNYINIPQTMNGDSNIHKNGGNLIGDEYMNIPKHGHNLSDASSGFQSDSGDRTSLN